MSLSLSTGRNGARHEAIHVAGAECVERELFGGGAVCLGKERRHSLGTELVPEPVDEVLGWKPICRTAVVAEQIANGVVVLAVRQPPEKLITRRRGRRRQPLAGSRDGVFRERRQVTHPF